MLASEVTMGLADRTPPSEAEYADYRKRFSNWGRWGADDELGTLNFVTDEVRRSAAALVQTGRAISCSRPIDTKAGPANPYPAHHFVAVGQSGGMLDYVGLFIHGITNTHIDALCHLPTVEGRTWNDGELKGDHMPEGKRGTIEHWKDGIVTRGVLYDVPRLRGSDYVEPGQPVHGWELQDCAAAQGSAPAPGDAVLIRSGLDPYFEKTGATQGFGSPTGVHASCIEFLHETQASCLIWDLQDAPIADQGIPNPMAGPVPLHVHHILLPYMGMPIIDNADFEALAAACAELGRWEFQLVVAPLLLEGGTGSPVNPIAVL
jgi:kynurenine formamidase